MEVSPQGANSDAADPTFELAVSGETQELDYEARRDALSAAQTGEAALVAEPYESLLWYAPGDPALEGREGAERLVRAAAALEGFFKQFAKEQAPSANGSRPKSGDLRQRLEAHTERFRGEATGKSVQ